MEHSRGLPRRVNVLCDRALEEGRIAGSNQIDTTMVRRAVRSLASAGTNPPAPAAYSDGLEMDSPIGGDGTESRRRDLDQMFGPPPPRKGRLGLVVGVIVLVVAVTLAAAAGYYAWTIVSQAPALPSPQVRPKLNVGEPPPRLPLPSDEEIERLLAAIQPSI